MIRPIAHSGSVGAAESGTGERLIRALRNPCCYDHPVGSVQVIETHISWVLLAGEYAYKIKKPVRLPFVDFSTLQRRRGFCEEELRLNRRLAPDIYLGVVPIGGVAESPVVGAQPAIEYAVKLLRFPPDARLDERLREGSVPAKDIRELAGTIADFHAALTPSTSYGSPVAVTRAVLSNLQETEQALPDPAELTGLYEWVTRNCVRLERVFSARKHTGAVRECHGDLHLENLVYWNGRIVPFDALEFDPRLRGIDVMDEAAFLVMDLMAHEEPGLAFEFLNSYLEITGDYPGLEVARFYLVHRALVRAKVAAIKETRVGSSRKQPEVGSETERYLRCSKRFIAPAAPLLVITHGLSASGKTSVTSGLISRMPAIRVRADLERKRLYGVPPLGKSGSGLGTGLYAPRATRATYAALLEYSALSLRAGFSVMVDATFLMRAEREQFVKLAAETKIPFAILSFRAPEPVLRRRIRERAGREGDASEATLEVLDHQLAVQERFSAEELAFVLPMDTEEEPDLEALGRRLGALRHSRA